MRWDGMRYHVSKRVGFVELKGIYSSGDVIELHNKRGWHKRQVVMHEFSS